VQNSSAFFGESDAAGLDDVVFEVIAAVSRYNLPLVRIKSSLRCALEFYKVSEELELKFGRARFLKINEDRN
jgi:hypothetical protein